MPPLVSALRALLAHRRRLAPLVIVGGLLVVGWRVFGALPQEIHLRYDLGDAHAAVEEAELGYFLNGESYHTVRFGYPEGAPSRIDHRLRAGPGRYDVVVILRTSEGATRVEQTFEAPTEGIVRLYIGK
jgi:hypothetical protein